MRTQLAFALLLFLAMIPNEPVTGQDLKGDRVTGPNYVTRSPVIASNGAAATSHPLATQVAIEILKQGGSAADAAIAANAALGVMEPTGCGIGGDLFAIVWDPGTRRLHGLNASGRSAQSVTFGELKDRLNGADQIPLFGPEAITVPGAVDGWFDLHERFGSLPMDEILRPAIEYAREGHPVHQVISFFWAMNQRRYEENLETLTEIDNWRNTFLVDGRPPEEGEIFRNPDLAATYEKLARGGRDAFYRGELADVMDAYARRVGMLLRMEDFEAHRSEWVDPVSVNYRGYDVYQLPPNPQGIAGLQMLNILEGFDLAGMGHNSADYLHVQIEAKKLAFEDRARYYADPDFYDVPLDRLLSGDYAEQRRALIDMNHAAERVSAGDLTIDAGTDTIYLTVADRDGMMVSLIQSNYTGMGSGFTPDGLGFVFHNRGSQFNLRDPEHPNAFAPGKRPFHTIIPAFVLKDGEPFLSFGVMGGGFQPQGHVQIISNIIDFGMDVQQAGDVARYSHAGSSEPTGSLMTDGGFVQLESGIGKDVIEALARRGHVIRGGGSFGGYQAIMWDRENRVYRAASEMRKDGHAAGF